MQKHPNQRGSSRAKSHLNENVGYQLFGADGEAKLLFKDFALNRAILSLVRRFYSPYKGSELRRTTLVERMLTHLALYGIRVPGITGMYSGHIVVANGVTSAGLAGVASRINGSGAEAAFTFVAVGTGVTAFNVADTTLGTELAASGLSRAAASVSRVTTDVTNDTAQNVLSFTVTGTAAVTESGVLNAASSGVLLCRQTFSAINVVNGDSLQITWKIDVD